MSDANKLQYIKHQDIDYDKWDRCIDEAINCRIYAYTWQLDRAAQRWDALVYGDYEYVMPLPVRSKFGIKYLYQPMFSQQLGIFPLPEKALSSLFYKYISEHFRYAQLNLNSANLPDKKFNEITFSPRKNYLLPLAQSYKSIIKFYSTNARRNIAKANKNKLNIVEGIRLETFLEFKLEHLPENQKRSSFNSLKSMVAYGQYKGFGEVYGVYTADNELCAAVYFCRWKDRVIYFNAASSDKGKELRAMYFLLNEFVRKNAGRNLILDFEGSVIPGVARFFEGFGATPETYFQLKINRLPLPLKWIKR